MSQSKHKSKKGKHHPAHATSFINVSAELLKASMANAYMTPNQAVEAVAFALRNEGERLRTVVR